MTIFHFLNDAKKKDFVFLIEKMFLLLSCVGLKINDPGLRQSRLECNYVCLDGFGSRERDGLVVNNMVLEVLERERDGLEVLERERYGLVVKTWF
ncbi:hypothetical protein AMTRI_Chr07g30250 [Amborella trichopoda]